MFGNFYVKKILGMFRKKNELFYNFFFVIKKYFIDFMVKKENILKFIYLF